MNNQTNEVDRQVAMKAFENNDGSAMRLGPIDERRLKELNVGRILVDGQRLKTSQMNGELREAIDLLSRSIF